MRRIKSNRALISLRRSKGSLKKRNKIGITRSLQIIVLSAIAATITIPVAADNPPINTNKASQGWPSAKGNAKTNVSASTPPSWKYNKPPNAMGNTNRLINKRYSGNIQTAWERCLSSVFSTTITWNWRGRKIVTTMAKMPKVSQFPSALDIVKRLAKSWCSEARL